VLLKFAPLHVSRNPADLYECTGTPLAIDKYAVPLYISVNKINEGRSISSKGVSNANDFHETHFQDGSSFTNKSAAT